MIVRKKGFVLCLVKNLSDNCCEKRGVSWTLFSTSLKGVVCDISGLIAENIRS